MEETVAVICAFCCMMSDTEEDGVHEVVAVETKWKRNRVRCSTRRRCK